MNTLINKVAVITGAASGMGKAMALLFAAEGAKVVATDTNQEGVNQLIEEIRGKQHAVVGVTADVSNPEDVQRIMDTAIHEFGRIDILVNNAGVMDDFMPVAEVSDQLWNRVLGINLNGPFYLCRLAVPLMLKQGGGNILNISSIGGLNGARAGAAYTASKHALIGLTKNIAFYYGDQSIRCNTIAPGGVKTNIGKDMKPNKLGFEKLNKGIAASIRFAEADEIARTALFLVSGESSFINGATIVADGGWTAY